MKEPRKVKLNDRTLTPAAKIATAAPSVEVQPSAQPQSGARGEEAEDQGCFQFSGKNISESLKRTG